MLKVAHIITGLEAGGAEGVLSRLCLADTGDHHDHVVISLTSRGSHATALEQAGIRVLDLGMMSTPSVIAGVWRLRGILKNLQPDVVQTWMYHADLVGGIAARLAGIRSVVWGIRNTAPYEPTIKPGTRMVIRACALLSHSIPERIILCATNSLNVHEKIGYQRQKMVVVQNGIDTRRFHRDDTGRRDWRSKHGLGMQRPLIGLVARYSPQKDFQNMLKALQSLALRGVSFQCVLVGNHVDRTNRELTSLVEACGLTESITLMGPRIDIPQVMRALDLHVLPSRVEGFPNVLAEAMASGTPCVSTDVGDAEFIIGDCGWLIPRGDSEALANAIGEALTEYEEAPDRWQQRRDDCEWHIRENFGLQQMVEKFSATWADVARVR